MVTFSRLAIVVSYLFTRFFERSYHSFALAALIPLPAAHVYAWAVNGHHHIEGNSLAALVISALLDLGLIGHGEYHRRRAG